MISRLLPQTLLCVLIGLSIALGASGPDAQAANVGFQLLEEPTGPRAIGMGSAGTAMPGGGFAYYNPALPWLARAPYVSVDYGQYAGEDADEQRGTFEASWNFAKAFFGASFTTFSINKIKPADERGVSDIDLSWRTSMLSLTGGFAARGVALGLCVNGAQDGMEAQFGYALSVSGGVAYWVLPGKLSLGAAGFHAGTSSGQLEESHNFGQGAPLPMSARLGAGWDDTLGTVGYSVAADVTFRNANNQIMVPIGIEVRPVPQIALRAGKRLLHETEIINLGIGLNAQPLRFDASFVIPRLVSDTELKWQLGLTLSLVPPKPAPAAARPVPAPAVQPLPRDSAVSPEVRAKPATDSTSTPEIVTSPISADSAVVPVETPTDSLLELQLPEAQVDSTETRDGELVVPAADSLVVPAAPDSLESGKPR